MLSHGSQIRSSKNCSFLRVVAAEGFWARYFFGIALLAWVTSAIRPKIVGGVSPPAAIITWTKKRTEIDSHGDDPLVRDPAAHA
jgi:hypothetical protein